MLAEIRNQDIYRPILKTNSAGKPVKRSDYVALAIATCGIGYMPFVPASWGSLLGVGIYLLAQTAHANLIIWAKAHNLSAVLLESFQTPFTLIFLIGLFLIGIKAATRVEKLLGKKDARIIVIDEIVGQLITFLFVPAHLGWWTIIAGFFAFRFFDIVKIYPADKFEKLPAGLGVMADDAMAGFYAAALMSVLCSLYLAIF
jgi:phosphatidylglycerophosphatase A